MGRRKTTFIRGWSRVVIILEIRLLRIILQILLHDLLANAVVPMPYQDKREQRMHQYDNSNDNPQHFQFHFLFSFFLFCCFLYLNGLSFFEKNWHITFR